MGYQHGASNIWFNYPGIQTAYQPVGAPGYRYSLQNVGNGLMGLYTASAPNVAPTWTPSLGWTFNGSSQYLISGVASSNSTTAIVQFTNAGSSTSAIFGEYYDGSYAFLVCPNRSNQVWWYAGSSRVTQVAPGLVSGNLCFSALAQGGYRNGIYDGSVGGTITPSGRPIWIGSRYYSGGPDYWPGNIQAFAIYSRGLTPVEIMRAVTQMKYCSQNPDWNAWAPRRQYSFTAATQVFNAAWGRRHNTLLGGGVN